MGTDLMARPVETLTVREEFGAVERQSHAEIAATAQAERQKANAQARFIVAFQRPRDMETFRVLLEKECKRPDFAAIASYRRKVGRKKDGSRWIDEYAEGPSIRLIEVAIRLFRNIDQTTEVLFDGPQGRVYRCTMVDLETNSSWSTDVTVSRTVEKRSYDTDREGNPIPPKGRVVAGPPRQNSDGDWNFPVLATDDEM
jgi:hypothetical protein